MKIQQYYTKTQLLQLPKGIQIHSKWRIIMCAHGHAPLINSILELKNVQHCATQFVHSFDTNDLYSRRGDMGGTPSYGTVGHIIQDPSTVLLDFPSTATSTRSFHDLKHSCRTDIHQYSFFPKTIHCWNKLPRQAIMSTSLSIF